MQSDAKSIVDSKQKQKQKQRKLSEFLFRDGMSRNLDLSFLLTPSQVRSSSSNPAAWVVGGFKGDVFLLRLQIYSGLSRRKALN